MSKDLNLCQFIGRIGQTPEIKYNNSGSAIANLSIACGDDYKDKNSGQKVEQTNWIRVVAFGRLAEIIGEYTKKGSQIYISGKQVTRKWTDQQGNDRYSTEIVADQMQMLDAREGGANPQSASSTPRANPQSQGGQQAPAQPAPATDFDDDIPF